MATRGVLRVRLTRLRPRRALGGAGTRRVGDRQADRRAGPPALAAVAGDPELGETFYSVGLIEGGVAPNVISPPASAEVMFRIVGSADDVLAALEALEPR